MSISKSDNMQPEITRNRFNKRASISRVFKNTKDIIENKLISSLTIFIYIITGIKELLNDDISTKWYILIVIMTIIFTLDQINILEGIKEKVIKEKSKLTNINEYDKKE